MARSCGPAATLPGAAMCDGVFVFVFRHTSEPSGRLPLGLSLKLNMHLQRTRQDRADKGRSSLPHRPQNSARARYEKQTGTKALRRLQQNAKLRKTGLRAHEGDCNIKRLKLP